LVINIESIHDARSEKHQVSLILTVTVFPQYNVNLSPSTACRHIGRVKGQLHSFLNSALDGGEQ